MRAIVSGAAGFIGSALVDALLQRGNEVLGIDSLTDYYSPLQKRENLQQAFDHSSFSLIESDLLDEDLDLCAIFDGAEVVFHQAAQPGVRQSWRSGFATYARNNVLVTQRALEAAVQVSTPRFIYASSSSVYGNQAKYPAHETDLPRPHSPYGVTKLAGEHLCNLYGENFDLRTISMRYFTVYGPRQRPDMAIHRLIEAALNRDDFPQFGDGSQIRDFTFVDDVVEANVAASKAICDSGTVVNIAGGGNIAMTKLVDLAESLVGLPISRRQMDAAPGDVQRTGGSIEKAAAILGWRPSVGIEEGIVRQLAWHRARSVATT